MAQPSTRYAPVAQLTIKRNKKADPMGWPLRAILDSTMTSRDACGLSDQVLFHAAVVVIELLSRSDLAQHAAGFPAATLADILSDHAARADGRTLTDCDTRQNDRTTADPHMVTISQAMHLTVWTQLIVSGCPVVAMVTFSGSSGGFRYES